MGGEPGLGKGLGGLWKDWKAGWAGCQMIYTCRENQSPAIAQQYTWEEIGKRAAKIKTFRQGRQLTLSQFIIKSSNVCKILGDLVGPPHFQLRKRKQFAANQKFWGLVENGDRASWTNDADVVSWNCVLLFLSVVKQELRAKRSKDLEISHVGHCVGCFECRPKTRKYCPQKNGILLSTFQRAFEINWSNLYGGILKEQLPLRVFRVSKKSAKKAKCKDQPKNPLQERKSTTLSIQQLARRNWVLKIFFSFLKIDFLSTLSVQCWSSSSREGGGSGHG